MTEDKKSGELILQNIEMFNEASIFFGASIEPKILKGVCGCIEAFANNENWGGEFNINEEWYTWLGPKAWMMNSDAEKEEEEWKAWFELSYHPKNTDDYWTALLCNAGSQGGQAGFSFEIEPKKFGGKRNWEAYLRNTSNDFFSPIYKIGFQRIEGRFFLPIQLSGKELGTSWLAEDPYTSDDECFSPLNEGLEKLKSSLSIFDAIMQNCLDKIINSL